jgi:ubiquinone/menaquinone biosynthesis C-methylase UbiE
MTTAISERHNQMWNAPFRLGAYDLLLPINFDQSIAATFAALAPARTDHILDVGCGSGRLLVHAAEWLRAGGRWTGVDITQGGLDFAERRGAHLGVQDRLNLVRADMRELTSHLPGKFDGALVHFAVFTLAAEQDRRRVIEQIASVLRPGGRLAITVPSEGYRARALISHARELERKRTDISAPARLCRQWLLYTFLEEATRRHIESKLDADIFHRYSSAELESHLAAAGFKDISVQQRHGVESYLAVATRT